MIRLSMGGTEDAERSRLEELYVRHAPNGIRLAYLLTGDRATAEDLVQEAFARFVGRLHFLREADLFEAYLRRTIVNLTKNVFRRGAVERAYVRRVAGQRQAEHPSPDVPTYEMMRTALLGLPPRQRAAIVLHYYEDLSESAIADILRCRPATVRSLVSRGIQTLRMNPEVIR